MAALLVARVRMPCIDGVVAQNPGPGRAQQVCAHRQGYLRVGSKEPSRAVRARICEGVRKLACVYASAPTGISGQALLDRIHSVLDVFGVHWILLAPVSNCCSLVCKKEGPEHTYLSDHHASFHGHTIVQCGMGDLHGCIRLKRVVLTVSWAWPSGRSRIL